jgi:hypothetical protein
MNFKDYIEQNPGIKSVSGVVGQKTYELNIKDDKVSVIKEEDFGEKDSGFSAHTSVLSPKNKDFFPENNKPVSNTISKWPTNN